METITNNEKGNQDSLILLSRILNEFSTSELLDLLADNLDDSPPQEFASKRDSVVRSKKIAVANIRECAEKVHKEECRVWREEEERLQMA